MTKPTNLTETVYINKQSNHPRNIMAYFPETIYHAIYIMQKNIPCNKNVFDRNIDIYQTALKIVALIEQTFYYKGVPFLLGAIFVLCI